MRLRQIHSEKWVAWKTEFDTVSEKLKNVSGIAGIDTCIILFENVLINQQEDVRKIVNLTENVVIIAEQTAAGAEQVATSASELAAGMHNYTEKSESFKEIAMQLQSGVGRFRVE